MLVLAALLTSPVGFSPGSVELEDDTDAQLP
jgi:hypothetical protein